LAGHSKAGTKAGAAFVNYKCFSMFEAHASFQKRQFVRAIRFSASNGFQE